MGNGLVGMEVDVAGFVFFSFFFSVVVVVIVIPGYPSLPSCWLRVLILLDQVDDWRFQLLFLWAE